MSRRTQMRRAPAVAARGMRGAATPWRGQAGLTLIEVVIATSVLAIMMVLVWSSIDSTSDAKRYFEQVQERNHEIRLAMNRIARDISSAYLSGNEDPNAPEEQRRTLFVAKSGGSVDELRFSSLGHRVLWADANESEQTLITYLAEADRDEPGKTNLLRRESRRLSFENWENEPAEIDLLLRDIARVEFEYWDWKDSDWQDSWNSTAADAERNRLPQRVRIKITANVDGDEQVFTTQARITMQETVTFQP